MNKLTSTISALALGVFGTSVSAEELRMLMSFPESILFTQEIGIPFAKLIEEESGGDLTVSMTWPDAIPPFEQFEPVQARVFDMLFTHPVYHSGVTSLGLAVDGTEADPTARRDGGILDYVNDHYAEIGMRVVGVPPMGTKPLRLYLKEPVSSEPAFNGLKIRSTVSYHNIVEALGGSGVVISMGETYSALQKGVVDGAAAATPAALDFKWNEVVDYIVDQPFGNASLFYMMNADTWDELSEDNKAAINRAAVRMENLAIERMDVHAAEEEKKMLELGVKMTSLTDAEDAQLDILWSEGVWAIGMKGNPEATAGLREVARKAGLSE